MDLRVFLRWCADQDLDPLAAVARHEAEAAQRAYRTWGYRYIGRIKPGKDTPAYDALMHDLPRITYPG